MTPKRAMPDGRRFRFARRRSQGGYALLFVLLVGAALGWLLAGAVELQYATYRQNRQAARRLQTKAETLAGRLLPPAVSAVSVDVAKRLPAAPPR